MTNNQHLSYRHVFGPIPSRRLGISLGVNLVPHKTYKLNCVYCEYGRIYHLTLKRREYAAVQRIELELAAFLFLDPPSISLKRQPCMAEDVSQLLGMHVK